MHPGAQVFRLEWMAVVNGDWTARNSRTGTPATVSLQSTRWHLQGLARISISDGKKTDLRHRDLHPG
jgi:hypothetical protein